MEKNFNGSMFPVAAMLTLSLLSAPTDLSAVDVKTVGHLSVNQTKTQTVQGIVKDDLGEVLPGASVVIAGTTQGVAADLDGRFSINVNTGKNVTLVISYLGMESQEIVVSPKTKELIVTLLPLHKALDEVVVTGFQTISRERSSGSAVILSKEKLTQIKAPDITSNLEGLVPGLTTYGGGMSIRGNSSFSISSQPLIVIDGMPVENITNSFSSTSSAGLGLVNPEDVENITVLKDAAATSLYGVRASNGVIVITTKKGSTQKPAVSISANFYLTQKNDLSYNKYASTADILDYELEYMLNDPTYQSNPLDFFSKYNDPMGYRYLSQARLPYYKMAMGEMTQAEVDAQIAGLRNRDYRKEYLKHFTRHSFTQDYNVSISQGNDFSQTYFSARFQDSKPESVDARSNKVALNLNNTFNFTKWLKFTTGMNMNIDQFRNKYMSGASATYFMPYDQILDEHGNRVQLYPFNQLRSEEVGSNPKFQSMGLNLFDEMESGSKSNTRDIYLKVLANAEVKLTNDLKMDVRFQYENITGKQESYSSQDSYEMREIINTYTSVAQSPYGDVITYNVPKGGRLEEVNRSMQNYNFRAQLNYSKVFNDKHALTALGGFEMRENKIRYGINERYGYDDQLLSSQLIDWDTLSRYGVVGLLSSNARKLSPNVTMADAKHRYISAYLNAGYTFDGKYSATASVRMDQADLFGTDPKYRYRPLWSVGASWNVNNEDFMKDLTWIDMLKLRTSYGITGNVDQNSTPFLLGFTYPSPETGDKFTDIMTPPNKLLRWEKTSTYNFGVDFAAWNRLNASIDVYRKYSSDLLAPKRFDPSMGFPEGRVNNGAMKNRGIEMSASYDWIRTKDWRFSTQLTAAYNKNTIEKIDFEPTNALDLLGNPNGYYLTGTSRGTMYAYHYQGLNEVGDPVVLDENGNQVSLDAVRDINAVYAVGQLTPKWNGMLNLSAQYRNIEFFTRFVYYTGHSMRNDVLPLYQDIALGSGSMHRDLANRWTPTNQGDVPAIGKYGADPNRGDHWKYADKHVMSASFIRARNIGFAYHVPRTFLQKLGLKSAVLRAQVDNPFTIKFNDEGIDPEAFNLNGGVRGASIRPTYTFGVNVNL